MKYYFIIILFLLISCKKDNDIVIKKDNNNFFYEKAWKNLTEEKNDSAFYYFNKAKINYLKFNDNLGSAKSMMNMSIIQSKFGDVTGSQENAVDALKIFEKIKDTSYIGTTLNILGTNEISLGNIDRSIKYLNKAIFYSNNKKEKDVYLNNKAMAFSNLTNSDSCFIILKSLIEKNESNLALYQDNLAYLTWVRNKNYNAEPELYKSLKIREKEKDLWGQNASQAHLADYFETKNTEKALFHAHKMYEIASELKSPDDEIEALQKLVVLENPTNSKKYFNSFIKLKDSLQSARNKAKNQFALIRYESEKTRADLLKSQAENTEKNYQLLLRNVALGFAVLAIIIGFVWFEKRRKRVKQEKEFLQQEHQLKIKNTELKYSKKVHDIVANGLYQILVEIQNQLKFNKEIILNKIEIMYEKSRDIAHENINENLHKDFSLRLFEMINSYSSENQKVLLVGNNQNLWQEVSENTKTELFYVIREILTNMKKHSKAKIISLKFQKEKSFLNIKYTDNGEGIKDFKNFKGSGIKNTENRIEVLGGKINFEQNIKGGLIIHINIPIH